MRLLVTGAGGLIGRHLVQAAAAVPHIELVASARRAPDTLPPRTRFAPADISDAAAAISLIKEVQPTHVVHCAWETRQPTYWHDLANLDWVASAAGMARAFAEAGGTRFVQLGSCAEYEWSQDVCVEGVTPDRPVTRYGLAKLAAFRAIEAAAHERFEAVEARIFFVYGPGENADRFIPYICRSHLAGSVPQLGSGAQQRDLLYVEDAASALLALLAPDAPVGVVNIGTGRGTALSEVAETLASLAGARESGLGRRPDRPNDPAILLASPDRLQETGWAPKWSLEEGLGSCLESWRSRGSRAQA